jgi:hypothetical protein
VRVGAEPDRVGTNGLTVVNVVSFRMKRAYVNGAP